MNGSADRKVSPLPPIDDCETAPSSAAINTSGVKKRSKQLGDA
jgi:hypothetical protein